MKTNSELPTKCVFGCSLLALTAASASAQNIDTDTSAPVATSTANGGAPGDITITENGSITIVSGQNVTAVTLDSDNNVINDGVISLQDIDGATGILLNAGQTGSFISNGVIEVVENYDRPDNNDDGELDGPFALGTNRTGLLLSGAGSFTGDIQIGASNSLTVEGNDSIGILLNSALAGSLVNDGIISVVGDNTTGISVQNGISADFLQSGTISVRGLEANAITIIGDVGGAFTNEGAVSASGFASTSITNYADPDTLTEDDTPIADRIDAEDLLDGGPAVAIGGSIQNGILNNGIIDSFLDDVELDDTTKDTIEDFDENRSTGSISSFGSGPALIISPDINPAAAGDLVIGEVVETVRDTLDDNGDDDFTETLATFNYDYGLINRGTITANGLNVGFEATAVRIEGSADGSRQTIIESGIQNTGTIRAIAYEADAVGLSLGSGADIGMIDNSGFINGSVTTEGVHSAVALQIENGAFVSDILNTGTVSASSSGNESSAIAIRDLSGSLLNIENQGAISAGFSLGGEQDLGLASEIAIDLSNHNASENVTLVQSQRQPVDDINGDDLINLDDVAAPSLRGDILLGAGDDLIDIQAGIVDGNIFTGAGDDILSLTNAEFTGDVDFGAGIDIFTLTNGAVFTGSVFDADNTLDLSATDSTIQFTNADSAILRNISISGDSVLQIGVDATDPNFSDPRIIATDTATIGQDSEIVATVDSFVNADLDLTLIQAGSLSIEGGAVDNISVSAPAIYNSTVSFDVNSLNVSLTPKTALDFGLNTNESAAYIPFLDVATVNDVVGAALTSYVEDDALVAAYHQLLPDYSDAMTRFLSNETSIATGLAAVRFDQIHQGRSGPWIQGHATYQREEQTTESTGYNGLGVSLQAGIDRKITNGFVVGAAGAFRAGEADLGNDINADIETTALDFSAYSTVMLGGFRFDAAGTVGKANFYSERRLDFGDEIEIYEGEWGGFYYAGSARISYEATIGKFYARPAVSLDYFSLSQNDYIETASNAEAALALAVGEADTARSSGVAILNIGRRSGSGENLQEANPRNVYGRTSTRPVYFQNAYFGYRSEIDATPYAATAQFVAAGAAFQITDPTAYEDAALFGLAFGALGDGYAFTVNYDGELAGDYMAHQIGTSFRLSF